MRARVLAGVALLALGCDPGLDFRVTEAGTVDASVDAALDGSTDGSTDRATWDVPPDAPRDTAPEDAVVVVDAMGDVSTDGDSPADSSTDAVSDAQLDGSDDGALASMDPHLALPDDAGAACTMIGSDSGDCDGVGRTCRIASPDGGRCEGCTDCGNLNALCVENIDCDILFQCYAGRCTNICPLGTYYCGPIEDCLDVGHETHGVCDPDAI